MSAKESVVGRTIWGGAGYWCETEPSPYGEGYHKYEAFPAGYVAALRAERDGLATALRVVVGRDCTSHLEFEPTCETCASLRLLAEHDARKEASS